MTANTGAIGRAVVSDDGNLIRLTLHADAQATAGVVLDPLCAMVLAGDLIAAAHLHLRRVAEPRRRQRGGDPHEAHRRKRDAALCALAPLVAPGVAVEQQARVVIDRVLRYHPAAGETGIDRQLMGQIRETGLPLPSVDRVARIIRLAAPNKEDALLGS